MSTSEASDQSPPHHATSRSAHLVGCHHCGLLQEIPPLGPRTTASCVRCHSQLERNTHDSVRRALALSITGLILFVMTNSYPLLTLQLEGRAQDTRLLSSVGYFFEREMYALSLLILVTCFLAPLWQLLSFIYLLAPLSKGRVAPYSAKVLRALRAITPWGMVEVFLIGLLVSMIKLGKLATLVPGPSIWAYIGLIITLTATFSVLNLAEVWSYVPIKRSWTPPRLDAPHFTCLSCHLTFAAPPNASYVERCPRCDAKVSYRKRKSVQRTAALGLAASLLYIPANVLPITETEVLGVEQADTIMSGVIFFLLSGSWHIALVIFIASVVIPLAKLLVLAFLLVSVRRDVKVSRRGRTILYHWTELVGRWSMVDVYVVTVLVALVQLSPFAVIRAGPGVLYFAGVVILTMYAAESFDPRILWDHEETS